VNNQPVGMIWLNNFAAGGVWPVIKVFMIIGFLMYVLFAVIMLKQVGVMTESFESEVNPRVRLIAWIHLFLSVILPVISVVIL